MRRFKSDTSGMIMIEGLLVFIITTFLLMLVLAMFGAMFQRWNIQTAANDAAAKLAQTYEYSEVGSQAKMETGYIDSSSALKVRPYRYIINKTSFEADAENRAKIYAEKQIKKSMLISLGSEISVSTEIHSDFLGRRHAEVTITNKFKVPFQNTFEYMGLGNMVSFTVTGYADCVDLLDYLNTVDFVDHATDPNHWFKSETVGVIDGLLELISKFVS